MLDLGRSEIRVKCPECDFTHVVRLEQVRLEQEFICEGCLRTIQLKDADKSIARSVDAIEGALSDLEESLRKGLT